MLLIEWHVVRSTTLLQITTCCVFDFLTLYLYVTHKTGMPQLKMIYCCLNVNFMDSGEKPKHCYIHTSVIDIREYWYIIAFVIILLFQNKTLCSWRLNTWFFVFLNLYKWSSEYNSRPIETNFTCRWHKLIITNPSPSKFQEYINNTSDTINDWHNFLGQFFVSCAFHIILMSYYSSHTVVAEQLLEYGR